MDQLTVGNVTISTVPRKEVKTPISSKLQTIYFLVLEYLFANFICSKFTGRNHSFVQELGTCCRWRLILQRGRQPDSSQRGTNSTLIGNSYQAHSTDVDKSTRDLISLIRIRLFVCMSSGFTVLHRESHRIHEKFLFEFAIGCSGFGLFDFIHNGVL